jgi:hypothetical protein
VNQQISLGGYYTSNDGNTYSFNGTSIIVQFTDYAVINLVEAPSQNIINRPNWDVNGDHICDITDIALIGLHFGETGSPGWIP